MINYRNIFNPNYSYIGLIIILLLIIMFIVLQKDLLKSISHISEISLISSVTTLVMTLILNLITKFILIGSYKVFIEIITKNLIANLYLYSLIVIVISILLIGIVKINSTKSLEK